jgi:cbb3-type cytochrome oxidase subunit 3
MPVENYLELLPIILLGIFFFAVTVFMLYWSSNKGHFRNMDAQAKVIFTEEEPEGELSDSFPDKR